MVIQRDAQTWLYLFPDCPETLEAFEQLRAGHLCEALLSATAPRSARPAGGPFRPPRCKAAGAADTGMWDTIGTPRSLHRSAA